MNNKRQNIAVIFLITVIIIKFLIWNDNNQKWIIKDVYYQHPIDEPLSIAPQPTLISTTDELFPATISDASKLYRVEVEGIVQPKNIEQIQETVQLAKDEKKKISMSGARHSMGGQNAFDNSIHLDMREFNNIQYNQEDQTVTVQSGATWKSIQNKLSKHNRSVQVMQDSNIFTVGGSIAVNAHGKDPNFSTLIHTVNEFQLVNAEGELITCSRTENPELFYAVHGGMGLFGVVTQVTLNTNPNNIYQTKLELFDSKDFLHNMEQSSADSELSEAHFSMDQDNLLKEVLVYNYKPTNTTKDVEDDITGENSIWLRKAIYRLARNSDWGQKVRWFLEKNLSPIIDPELTTRNTAMAVPVRFLELDDPNSTDILQEYFIPTDKVDEFIPKYRQLLQKHNINIVNTTVRKTLADSEGLLTYSPQENYGFVSYYKITKDQKGQEQMQTFVQELMDYLLEIDGKYYLAYNNYYTQDQIHRMYPKLQELFQLKQKYDPQELFNNQWYENHKI